MTDREATEAAVHLSDPRPRTAGPALKDILEALPPDTLLPVRWVLERLSREPHMDGAGRRTLSAQEFGERRRPARTADWVRQQCAEGRIAGAFKDGGEWRVPVAALDEVAPLHRRDATAGPPEAPSRYPRWRTGEPNGR